MSASNVRASSTHSNASTLRPRTKRLISGLDEGDETNFDPINAATTRIASPLPSPFDSRSASPIPSAHPQRPSPNARRNQGPSSSGSPSRAGSSRQRKNTADSPTFAGIWGNSWNALQGIASDLLGNELSNPDGTDRPRVRRPLSKLHSHRNTSSSAPPSQWGPSAPTSHPRSQGIGGGTKEEQIAALRAQKKKDMLTRQESSYPDALGKFKRRLSDDRNSVSAPPGENEDREALVYVHPVKKDETLAGITIRYNISANALRKANRMWPNDTIQSRQTLILPVDACGVKGKRVDGPQGDLDLLSSESEALSFLQAEEVATPTAATSLPNGTVNHANRDRTNSTSTNTTSSIAASSVESEPPWRHDSWVLLPGDTRPTVIARLPRRALGYFPPARRKSNSFSDLDTPSSSLDLVRSGTNDISNSTSPLRQTPPRPSRGRRLSNATTGYYPAYLTGPGGVGSMSRNVRHPGPAQDGLNKMFAKHLPDVAPPRNQSSLYQPDLPLYSDNPTLAGSGMATPAYPNSSGPNLNLNLENVGGAIESWVRRIATKSVSTPQDRYQAARVSVGTPGRGAGGIGDLIEMTDEFEIGGADDDEEEERGRSGSNPNVSADRPTSTATSYFDGAAVRGRGMPGNGAKAGKSGKSD
ncbi:carbohydrate-binding module family 50 protein [Zasmidium cellare ATCC 36951]|uniref:Carbohydrate-binding module family 50 protein n=1 Tax=Zasmidium cellare ATCC 36951 TaxID=1080233 RepID=A0A6A6CAV9_ZASCE|nr:carbohydrate-binding module family 50 protein [Zasmidium cellare ATCC 36951]KAF2164327.1 carbohydrate-binding module family 50 protein [Zasmidium cellare ATCC 36951]